MLSKAEIIDRICIGSKSNILDVLYSPAQNMDTALVRLDTMSLAHADVFEVLWKISLLSCFCFFHVGDPRSWWAPVALSIAYGPTNHTIR